MRVGRVTGVDPATGRARVAFEADDGVVSMLLPVMQKGTRHSQGYWMPDEGEHVVCLMDDGAEFGVILGAIYSDADHPPVASLDRIHLRMRDGTTFDYDRAAHRLSIALAAPDADVVITTTRDVHVSAGRDVAIDVPAGRSVFVGGAGGRQLATVDFVTDVYMKHKHPVAGPTTGLPVPTGTETAYPNVTQKAKGE